MLSLVFTMRIFDFKLEAHLSIMDTTLLQACSQKPLKINLIKRILRENPNSVHELDSKGQNALHIICQSRARYPNPRIASLLIDAGVDLNAANCWIQNNTTNSWPSVIQDAGCVRKSVTRTFTLWMNRVLRVEIGLDPLAFQTRRLLPHIDEGFYCQLELTLPTRDYAIAPGRVGTQCVHGCILRRIRLCIQHLHQPLLLIASAP